MLDIQPVIFAYLIFINITTFIAFAIDKYAAQKKRYRIREKTLLTLAFAGGTIGALLGMYLIRHKTRKTKFTIGIPLITVLHIILFFWLGK